MWCHCNKIYLFWEGRTEKNVNWSTFHYPHHRESNQKARGVRVLLPRSNGVHVFFFPNTIHIIIMYVNASTGEKQEKKWEIERKMFEKRKRDQRKRWKFWEKENRLKTPLLFFFFFFHWQTTCLLMSLWLS